MHDNDKDYVNWEDRYWSFVIEHTACDGTPVIKDEPEEETDEDYLIVALSADCPGCGLSWSETVEAEALVFVDLADLRLAVTNKKEWQRRAFERMWKLEEKVKRILPPSKPDRPNSH